MFDFFKSAPKSYLGIDIGTSSIKIVQLGIEENRAKLETYGFLETYGAIELLRDTIQTSSMRLLDAQVVDLLKKLLEKSKVTTRNAIISIPVFSTFSALMELPDMPYKEVEAAIPYEARQYIPVPIPEVILGWNIIGKKTQEAPEGPAVAPAISKIEVLLIATPKEVANKYANITRMLGLNLKAIEAESFALERSLIGDDKVPTVIVDIGSRVTNILMVDNGYVMINKGLDTSGNELTKILSHALNVDFRRAELLKRETGLLQRDDSERSINKVILPVIDIIINEVKRVSDFYLRHRGKKVERIILCGGSAHLPGLVDYFSASFNNLPVVIGNPWRKVIYPSSLEPILNDLGPSFSVAVGLAMREL